jgi:hypothetical protein
VRRGHFSDVRFAGSADGDGHRGGDYPRCCIGLQAAAGAEALPTLVALRAAPAGGETRVSADGRVVVVAGANLDFDGWPEALAG